MFYFSQSGLIYAGIFISPQNVAMKTGDQFHIRIIFVKDDC